MQAAVTIIYLIIMRLGNKPLTPEQADEIRFRKWKPTVMELPSNYCGWNPPVIMKTKSLILYKLHLESHLCESFLEQVGWSRLSAKYFTDSQAVTVAQ